MWEAGFGSRQRYAADADSGQLSPPIGRLDGGSRRRKARQEAVGLELEERFGIAQSLKAVSPQPAKADSRWKRCFNGSRGS